MSREGDVERAYADQEAQETERWVGETLRNVSVIAAGMAAYGDSSDYIPSNQVPQRALEVYLKLEQLVREAAP